MEIKSNSSAVAQPPPHQGRNGVAVAYMIGAVLCISLTPLWIALGEGYASPFLFNCILRFDVAVIFWGYLWLFHKSLLFNRQVLYIIKERIIGWAMIFTVVNNFDFAAFAWSTRFIDISMSAVLFELWAIFIIFLMHFLYRKERRYTDINAFTVCLLLYGFVGVMFVVASQTGQVLAFEIQSSYGLYFGLLLAIGGAFISAFAAFNFRWSTNLRRLVLERELDVANASSAEIEMFAVVFAFAISNSVASLVSGSLGVISGESLSIGGLFTVFGGALAQGTGSILWRKSNLISDHPSINAIAYAIPIFSLAWLAAFSFVGVPRPDYLVIGSAVIIAINLIINFEAEIRWGFKALILALGVFGTVVYMRDDVFDLLGITQWGWRAGDYFEAIALSATVFTLLLAFRVARLVSRSNAEEIRTFSLLRKLDLLSKRGVVSRDVIESVRRFDEARGGAQRRASYLEIRSYIMDICPLSDLSDIDRQTLSEAEVDLDTLARSKQLGSIFGELFALLIFGGVTVGLALLSYPLDVAVGWIRVLADLFAMLISAVIIFLIVNVWDLHQERNEGKLELWTERGDYVVKFSDTTRRLADQGLSALIGFAVVVTYAVLLAYKWLP